MRIPGLLPWQLCLLAYGVGVLATRALIPAGVTLLVLWAADAALRKRRVHPAAVLLCALAGFFYAASVLPVRPSVPDWLEPGRKVGVRAVVDSVRTKPDMRLQMVLRDVTVLGAENGQDRTLPGMMAWTWKFPKNTPQPGQQVLLNVGLRPVSGFQNPGLWDYEAYWQREGVFWLGWSYGKKGVQLGPAPDGPLWRLREALKQPVLEGIGRGQGGAMVLNLLTGDRTHISPATLDMVRSAGLAHILALSGLHVGYVALMGFLLAYLVGVIRPRTYLQISRPKLAVLLAAPMVLVYWWLGQPSASLTRAALMFACWGGLLLFGRGRALLDGLFIALAVIIFHNPLAMFDTGLRMSACAVAGIALLYPVFRRVLAVRGHGAVRRVADSVAVLLCLSLSANAALLPVMAVSFGAISPNILMNVVWVPAVGFLVMPLGIAGMVLGTVPEMQVVSNLLVHGAASVADWLLLMLRHFHEAGFDPMFAVLRPLWPEALGFTLLLVTALAGRKRLCLAALGSALILLPHLYVMTVDARSGVRLAMIDVGQGQALLVAAPGGRRVLVDGGGTASRTFDIGRAVVGPYLASGRPPRLDAVVMTHADNDHMGGLAWIVERFAVNRFIGNGDAPDGVAGARIMKALDARGIPRIDMQSGDAITLGRGAVLRVLHPGNVSGYNSNDSSLVLRLEWNDRVLALLTGDIEQKAISDILRSGVSMKSQVLVMPHHGSKGSSPEMIVPAVGPEIGLISCRRDNRYGFPHPSVLGALRDVGALILRTDIDGAAWLCWDDDMGALRIETAVSNRKNGRMQLFLPVY